MPTTSRLMAGCVETWISTFQLDLMDGLHRNAVFANCDALENGNAGCGVTAPAKNSFGPAFNAAGGGWYAMERTPNFIKVWFWSRQDGSVPSGVKNGHTSVNTDDWVRKHFTLGIKSKLIRSP